MKTRIKLLTKIALSKLSPWTMLSQKYLVMTDSQIDWRINHHSASIYATRDKVRIRPKLDVW